MLSSDLQKLSVTGLVTLYELDATKLGGDVYRWHGHVSFEDWRYIYEYTNKAEFTDKTKFIAPVGRDDIYKKNIIWQGQTFSPMPITTDGLEIRGDSRPSSPSLAIANMIDGQLGAVGVLCAYFNDFVGAKLKVIRVLAKYLDAANFADGNPSADPTQFGFQDWEINKKTRESLSESSSEVVFELSTPLTAQNQKIPSRTITKYCDWCIKGKYRGESCGYTGAAMFTKDGKPTDNPALDECGGLIRDCKLRFGENQPLRHGGFASSRIS
ncbi:phage minor tail protein L [Psychrobacter pygoscelis]|uniref:phage minor tail protein L n=1 Tax=Psychrobacter pygoscelis TaxID=2488563 RepID=UPI00103BA28B|nr:phage minor tail protein L [Psychrobacter pygoscelis]